MEVIGYQLFIIATILITHFVKRNLTVWVCIFWTVETVLLLQYIPLVIIQLCVVWISWSLLEKNRSQNIKINELESFLTERPEVVKKMAEAVPESQKVVLQGTAHKAFLLKSITEANSSLIILSGWITDYVINKPFLRCLEDCIRRGVTVYIGYGWQNSKGEHDRFDSSERAINELKLLMIKYPGQLLIGEFANHEKILIKDAEYVVYGSNNWLSNSKFKNSERSIVVHDTDLASCEQERIMQLVRSNMISSGQ